MTIELIDTHAHLNFPQFEGYPIPAIIKNAKENGIMKMINVGSDLEGSRFSAEVSAKYEEVYGTVGIHPHDAEKALKEEHLKDIIPLLNKEKIVGIGEIGLDYFKNYSPKASQMLLLQKFMELAAEHKKPVIIHNRDADNDIYEMLNAFKDEVFGVVHCFSSDTAFAKKILDLGYYLSFTGNITYPKTEQIQEVVKYVPEDRFMVETDCPFLAPQAYRGKRNEPAYVKYVAEKISEIKNMTLEKVAEITTRTAKSFFSLTS
ncbi:TatD family hydrolase [Candidatus Margulisiibacteriota bacterium]